MSKPTHISKYVDKHMNRIKRDNKPVGDQMKTLLGTR